MGKFKDFFFRHLGKSEGAKALYNFLQEKEYNSFEKIRFCTAFEKSNPPQIGSSLLQDELRTLIEFIRLGGDFRESQLTITGMHLKVTEAKLKQCLISQLQGHAVAAKDTNDELMEILKQLVLSQVNPYESISESHYSKQDSAETREESVQYYGLESDQHCQILGPNQHKHVKIVNAYIWPRSAANQLPIFGLAVSDIHNPRNVLRLHQCIERAFDRREVTFVPGQGENVNQFILKVFPDNLRTTKLKGTSITFEEIDGKTLYLSGDDHLPFTRLLTHHVVLCHRYARQKNWVKVEDLSPVEVQAGALLRHSLDEQAQQRIKYWRAQGKAKKNR